MIIVFCTDEIMENYPEEYMSYVITGTDIKYRYQIWEQVDAMDRGWA